MKHSSNQRRGRSRGSGGKRHQSSRGNSHESNGPDGKVRGSAQQIHEKYISLARDASSAGEHIAAEGFFQFAEHYFRLVNLDATNNQNRTRDQKGESQQIEQVQNQDHAQDAEKVIHDETNGAVLNNEKRSDTDQDPLQTQNHDGAKGEYRSEVAIEPKSKDNNKAVETEETSDSTRKETELAASA